MNSIKAILYREFNLVVAFALINRIAFGCTGRGNRISFFRVFMGVACSCGVFVYGAYTYNTAAYNEASYHEKRTSDTHDAAQKGKQKGKNHIPDSCYYACRIDSSFRIASSRNAHARQPT